MDYSLRETTARVKEWQYLTGADFDAMDRKKTIAVVSCSPLEVHGPHLPVITDNWEAEGLLLGALEKLSAQDESLQFVHLPPIWVAADVLPHPGSVNFRSSTIIRVLSDLGRSLSKQGFEHIWVSSFHGGPRHFVPLEVACDRTNRKYGTKMVSLFSMLIRRLTGGGTDLTSVLGAVKGIQPEQLMGDTHGGAIETSLMLHLLKRYVDPVFQRLERMTVDLDLQRKGKPGISQENVVQILKSFGHKLKYFEDQTYAGDPAAASEEVGAQMADVLTDHCAEALSQLLSGEVEPEACRSPLWPLRWAFTSRTVGWMFERSMRYENRVF